MSESDFPSEAAKAATLLLPQVCDPYQNEDDPRKCFLRYDATHKALVVMTEDTEEVMDILQIDDVIGASIQIAFHDNSNDNDGGNDEPRSTAGNLESNEPASPVPVDTQAAATLTIYVYPRKDPSNESIVTSCTGKHPREQPVKEFEAAGKDPSKLLPRYPHHRTFQVAPAEDFANLSALVQGIRTLARPESPPSKERLLVIVNPFSGRKQGLEIYQSVVMSMLEQAGIDHDELITTHAGHAEEQMAPKDDRKDDLDGIADITKYDGLVAIGGDGSIYEIMQGIQKRPDCEKVLKNLKLGHIGAGTSNGLSASLAHACQVRFQSNE